VVIADPHGKSLYENPSFQGLFLLSAERKRNIFDLFENSPVLIENLHKMVGSAGSFFLRDIFVMGTAGQKKRMDVDLFPLIGKSSAIIALGLIFYDRSLGVSFEEHQKRIDRINYLATIASGLAHEIKNPLSGIKGAAELLSDALQNNVELAEYASIIKNEAIRVDRLLLDLMHFTKPRKLHKKLLNVNQLLHDQVLLQKTVEPTQVEFVEEYDPSLPEIEADAEAMTQVFLNLLKNARQSIKREGRVTVCSRVVTDMVLRIGHHKRQFIGIDVKDTGEGIAQEVLTKVFVPFFTTKSKGTGLGLALCHQIVEEHEGNMQVKSEKGKGTAFTVYLPV
jgi:two-component system nitrogen regulation sensor histidine kinase GlnL